MFLLPLLFVLQQAPGPQPDAETRSVILTATDEKGTRAVRLEKDEVALLENGVARPLAVFERDTRPLTLVLLVDSSAPMASIYRLYLVDPIVRFLQSLPAGSRFAVWTTGDRTTRLLDFGSDAAAVSRALRQVAPRGGNTVLDGLVEAADELVDKEGERSAVLAVTGTGIGFSNYDRQTVVQRASRPGLVFHAVVFDERGSPEIGAAGPGQVESVDYDYVLSNLTSGSGGTLERVLSAMGVAGALEKVGAAIDGQYRLAYETSGEIENPKLEVKVARPGVKARLSPPGAH